MLGIILVLGIGVFAWLPKYHKDPQSKAVLKSLNIDRLFFMELQQMPWINDAHVASYQIAMHARK